MSRRRTILILASLPLLLALTACTSTGSGGSPGAGGSAAPSSGGKGPDYDYGPGSGASAAPSDAAGGLTIGIGSGAAGTYLTGPNGMTLYIFTKDSEDASACSGDCANAWPPLTSEAGQAITAGDGVPGALSTFTREDGSLQVSYNGKPLYYFAADKAAGDTTGDGVNDVWFIAEP